MQNLFTNELFSTEALDARLKESNLPAADPLVLYELSKLYKKNQVVIVHAETGAGKGIAISPFIMLLENVKTTKNLREQAYVKEVNKVVVTEPRSLNTHIADYLRILYGPIVGRAYRGKNLTGPSTRLDFVTDGFLANILMKENPYKTIIIDEVHERNLNIDTVLALCHMLKLKTVLLSATMDIPFFERYFDTKGLLKIPGRTFPIEDIYIEQETDYIKQAAELVAKIDEDVLVFLSSAYELKKACKLMDKPCYELHKGNLEGVNEFLDDSKPKVIFSTNVAESGVTLKLSCVVDIGLSYKSVFNAKEGIYELNMTTISQAEAEQRRGRAGRISPGRCYHLYSRESFENFAPFKSPEIMQEDLTEYILNLMDKDRLELLEHLPTPPSPAQLQYAFNLLENLKLSENKNITELGRRVSATNLSVSEALTLFESDKLGVSDIVCRILAMRSVESDISKWIYEPLERNIKQFRHKSGELFILEKMLTSYMKSKDKQNWAYKHFVSKKIEQASKQYYKLKFVVQQFRKTGIRESNSIADVRRAFSVGFAQNIITQIQKNIYKINRPFKEIAIKSDYVKLSKKMLFLDIVSINGQLNVSNLLELQ